MPVFLIVQRTVALPAGPDDRRIDRKSRILEGRVAQPEAERKERLPGEIEVVVAAAGRLVIVDERQLPLRDGKGDRQSAGGIVVAPQHVGDRGASDLARIPDVDHGADLFSQGMVIALPPTSTTTTGLPVAATASISSS